MKINIISQENYYIMSKELTLNASRKREHREGVLLVSPVLVHLGIFVIIPIIYAFVLSFKKWNMLNPNKVWIGLDNYKKLLTDPVFMISLKNTFWYTIGSVPFCVILSLLLAVALKKKSKINSILRTCYFLPVIVSTVVTSVVFLWLFDPMIGLINFYLGKIGIRPLVWLSDPDLALSTLVIISIWKTLGYNMVIFIAGLQAIPDVYYEASTIDGANSVQQFFQITLPLLKPTTMFVLIMQVMNSFQVFDPVYLMTSGGPVNRTKVIVFYIYETAFYFFDMGYASALSFVLFVMTLILTLIQMKFFSSDSYSV